MRKNRISEKERIITNAILTVICYSLAFWVDRRVGLALFTFDISRIFKKK